MGSMRKNIYLVLTVLALFVASEAKETKLVLKWPSDASPLIQATFGGAGTCRSRHGSAIISSSP